MVLRLHIHRLTGLAKELQRIEFDGGVEPLREARVRGHGADLAALARLPGRKVILTNAPAAYAWRVLRALGIQRWFDDDISRPIEQYRPTLPMPTTFMATSTRR